MVNFWSILSFIYVFPGSQLAFLAISYRWVAPLDVLCCFCLFDSKGHMHAAAAWQTKRNSFANERNLVRTWGFLQLGEAMLVLLCWSWYGCVTCVWTILTIVLVRASDVEGLCECRWAPLSFYGPSIWIVIMCRLVVMWDIVIDWAVAGVCVIGVPQFLTINQFVRSNFRSYGAASVWKVGATCLLLIDGVLSMLLS